MSVPFHLRSINAETVGELLGYSPRHVCERLAAKPDFPKRCDIGGKPRWKAQDILDWRDRQQQRRAG